MNLLHLIKCAALHICRYRRLLIWNLFAYCLYTSCSAQVKHGVRDIKAPIRGGIESQLAPSRGHNKFNELKKNHDYFYAHTAPAPNKDKKNWLLPLISSIKSWYTKSTKHTDLFIAIENYCQLNPDPKHQDRAEVKINKILEKIKHRKIRYSSKRAITDENPLHLIVASHSMNGLSEGQRKFLEEVARTLVKDHAWLANDLNHIEKTPLHSAIRNGNVEMAQILLRSTDLATKGEVRFCRVYSKK